MNTEMSIIVKKTSDSCAITFINLEGDSNVRLIR